jgi:hypothetical protein
MIAGVLTERKSPGPWDDCTVCACGMLAENATGIRIGRAAIRIASGVYDRPYSSDPTTLDNGERALRKLWPGIALERPRIGWDGLVAKLRNGYGACVQGSNARLPADLRRWDPDYGGGHATFVRDGRAGGPLWYDPLAPEDYAGERIEWSALHRWMFATPAGYMYAMFAKELEAPMEAIPVTDQVGGRGRLLEGCQVYGPDMKPVRKIGEGGGSVISPFGTAGYRAVFHKMDGQVVLGFVRTLDLLEWDPYLGSDDALKAKLRSILPHAQSIVTLAK